MKGVDNRAQSAEGGARGVTRFPHVTEGHLQDTGLLRPPGGG